MPIDHRNLVRLMSQRDRIRNVCIMAHIDHGKTSLSDSLLASNGIIPPSMQGQIRYLDSRVDEQERGITMESSAISLYFRVASADSQVNEYLVNLIDSPGHIDFSSEVTTTSRLCDGAIILVDSIEGVCSQTVASLQQAWKEKLRAILVINKIDRLFSELQLTSLDAAAHLVKVVEQVNAVIGQLFIGKRMDTDESISDEGIYFDPTTDNVVFASAIDGWGFTIGQFAAIYEKKLGVSREKLRKFLWGNFYLDSKTKKVSSAYKSGKRTMFVQFIMDSIWAVYTAVQEEDSEKLEKIGNSLKISVNGGLKPIFHQWIPASRAVLLSTITCLPSAAAAQEYRTDLILENSPEPQLISPEVTEGMVNCDPDAEPIVYVSKVVQVPKSDLSTELVDRLSELRLRSERIRESNSVEDAVLGYARIYSGTISVGDNLDLLSPKFLPSDPQDHRTSFTVSGLYLLMGRDLVSVPKAYPGNIVGIAGLDGKIVKNGTVVRKSSEKVPNLASSSEIAAPILHVAVEPVDPTKLPELERGLELLNVSDSSVKISMSDKGEWVLATAGELHFERCFKDLQDRYARVELECSEPVVPFKETIISQPAQNSTQDPQASQTWTFGELSISLSVMPTSYYETEYKANLSNTTIIDRLGTNTLIDSTDAKLDQWESVVNGFRTAMSKGPLCGEPVENVTCVVTDLSFKEAPSGVIKRRLISATRELIYKVMGEWSPRLLLAMYLCDIQASVEVLGKVYAVITRRKGHIISEELKDGTPFFLIKAAIPIVESFGFSAEIRKRTSGSAHPQLEFKGFDILDEDPYWVPTTTEELEALGDTADKENNALVYVNSLRRQKGMSVNEKIVKNAEQKRSFRH